MSHFTYLRRERGGGRERERERKREKGRRQSLSGLKLVAHVRMNTQPALSSAHSSGEGARRFERLQRNVQDTGRCQCFGTLFTSKHSKTCPCYARGFTNQLAQAALQQQPVRITSTICQCCCPLFPLSHIPLEEKSQNSSYLQLQPIIWQGSDVFFFPRTPAML